MATCKACGKTVIAGKFGNGKEVPIQTILLDPEARCFAAVAEGRVYAEDGDKLFLSLALVEHKTVCRGRQQGHKRAEKEVTQAGKKC